MKSKVFTVCGIDEAGRGALAGPLVAAAVVTTIPIITIERQAKSPVRDSKKLSQIQREKVYQCLQELNIIFSTEIIEIDDINNHGIGWANKEVMRRLIDKNCAHHYILDGNLKLGIISKKFIVESIIDADATIPQVILAGIVAKVTRDRIMMSLHKNFPYYGWEQNKGYGTKLHIDAIKKFKRCYHHRTMFVDTALSKH